MNNKQEQQDLTLYDLIEQHFDFSEYAEDEKKETISDTAGLIMESALLRALDKGGIEIQERFDEFMDTEPDDEALNQYVAKNLPDFDEYIIAEIKALKDFESPEKSDIK